MLDLGALVARNADAVGVLTPIAKLEPPYGPYNAELTAVRALLADSACQTSLQRPAGAASPVSSAAPLILR